MCNAGSERVKKIMDGRRKINEDSLFKMVAQGKIAGKLSRGKRRLTTISDFNVFIQTLVGTGRPNKGRTPGILAVDLDCGVENICSTSMDSCGSFTSML